MNPTAFTILGLEVKWYGVLISLGMVLGVLLAAYVCKVRKVNYDHIIDTLIVALPAGIIGARLYYVIFRWSDFADNPLDVFNTRLGGLAIHGGIIFGFLAAYIFTKYKKYDLLSLADVAAPSIILAQAIGRWGNFVNMEVYGNSVSKEFISHFPEFIQKGMYIGGTYYHPTFLYESLWNLLVFAILMYLVFKVQTKGVIFFTYFGLYSLGRFFIEGIRTDYLLFMGLKTAQLVSIAGVIIWISYLIYVYKIKNK